MPIWEQFISVLVLAYAVVEAVVITVRKTDNNTTITFLFKDAIFGS
jgi:hypothetical protein